MKFVTLDGKRYSWKEVLIARREQRKAARQPAPMLFDALPYDYRPRTEKSASDRFLNPSLFEHLEKKP